MNLIPKINQFIEEINEFHPETDLEQDGKRALTFKDTFSKLRQLRVEIEKTKAKYPLDKYITIQYSGPVTVKVTFDFTPYVLYFDENTDKQIIDNVANDLLAIEEIIHIIPAKDAIIINFKRSSFDSPYKLKAVEKCVNIVAQKHNPEGRCLTHFTGKGDYTTTEYKELVVDINLVELHKDRLAYFYHRDLSNADESESIKYLISQGLSASDIGISRSKYFRIKPEIPVSQ